MSRSNPSNGQNLRLGVVLTLASLAIGSTFVTSTSAETVDDATSPTSMASSTVPDLSADTEVENTTSTTTVDDADAATTSTVDDAGIDVVVVGDGDGDGPGLFVIDTGDGLETDEDVDVAVDEAEAAPIDACAPIDEDVVVPDDDAFFSDGFSSDSGAWEPLAGRWEVIDGVYRQTDASGFDLITQLKVDPPEAFRISATIEATEGSALGAGFVIGQPLPADRSGAVVVDFTDGGRFLRWGRYDDATAQYVYLGGVAMSDSFDPSVAHQLTVEVRAERTMVAVDGIEVGMFDPVPFGRVGLVTSQSTVNFDDLRIEEIGT